MQLKIPCGALGTYNALTRVAEFKNEEAGC